MTLAILCALVLGQTQTGATYTDLHDFGTFIKNSSGASQLDGAQPQTSIAFDKAGNMYGTTQSGGPNNPLIPSGPGMVWQITTSGQYKDLHDFGGTVANADGTSGPDGWMPGAGIAIDSSGNLYGTTYEGGPNITNSSPSGAGIVWEITAAGAYKDLHDFGGTVRIASGTNGPDGEGPTGVLSLDKNGNLFGTSSFGGPNQDGVVWKIPVGGSYTDLHDFGGTVTHADGSSGLDGQVPSSGVSFDANGNMFGTTQFGGPNGSVFGAYSGDGILWEITAGGVYKDRHDFGGTVTNSGGSSGPDGAGPYWGVTIDAKGDLFGTTQFGGSSTGGGNTGIVWELTAAGAYKDLHDFGGTITNAAGTSGPDGEIPEAGVTLDANGNLFGTTTAGGPNDPLVGGDGMLWEITSAGVYKDLHDFGGIVTNASGSSGSDGTYPGQVTLDAFGDLYGTCYYGGQYSDGGMAWRITAAGPVTLTALSVAPNSVVGGTGAVGTVTLSRPADSGGTVVTLSVIGSAATVPGSATVPSGQATANFAIGTSVVTSSTSAKITAKLSTQTFTATLTVGPLAVAQLSLQPTTLMGGQSSTATLTLNGPAGSKGLTAMLSSNNSVATVPKSVVIAAGQKQTTFTIKTVGTAAQETATITAKSGSVSVTAVLTVTAPSLSSVSLNPTSVVGGKTSTGTVTISSVAPSGGMPIKLASNLAGVTVPASVSIGSGKTSTTFTVKTVAVTAQKTATITATGGSVSKTAVLTVTPPSLLTFTLNPTTLVGGKTSTGTVTISSAAPAGGFPIRLSSSVSAAIVPASVSVGAGKSSGTFTVKTVAVATQTVATITATGGAVSKTANLTISAPTLTKLSVSPTSVVGGKTCTGTLTISSAAPSSGLPVALSSSLGSATVPASVSVASGKTTATFTVKTTAVKSTATATISAKLGSVTKTAALTVQA